MDQSSYTSLRDAIDWHSVSFGYRTVELFKTAELTQAQQGYSVGPGGVSLVGDEEGDWQESWLVIGDEDLAGDPIFVDLAEEELPVYTARHGEGAWEPLLIAESFIKFFAGLALMREISEGRQNPMELAEKPLSERDVEAMIGLIATQNSKADMEFWRSWLVGE
ncbi:hypothetical protein EON80_13740 [bacterium]|nr:MAG: hypothetical protein EON80_13740 [bacterium]